MSGGHNKESPGQLFSGSSTSSVRRTSPVDLNLGAETSVGPPMMAVPSSLPIPRFPDVVEAEPAVLLASHHRRTQRHKDGANGFRMTATAAAPSTYQQHQTADKMDHEEMGALRHLASELNAALRLSEEENLLLKGNCPISLLNTFRMWEVGVYCWCWIALLYTVELLRQVFGGHPITNLEDHDFVCVLPHGNRNTRLQMEVTK